MTMVPSVILGLLGCVILGLVMQTVRSTAIAELPMNLKTRDLKMKGAHPLKNDEYFCTSYSVTEDDSYIVKFEALADASTAHHILVFGCMQPHSTDDYWTCGRTCGGGHEQILFAWAKNAPPLVLPKDVGRHIGSGAFIKYIVVQIHYAHALDAPDFKSGIKIYTTEQRQEYVAGIYLLMAYNAIIPANTSKVHVDISCRFNWMSEIHPFGYRTHAHVLGTVISGYRLRDGEYTLIGKGNPQWPQAFYPVGSEIDIQAGDVVGARCTFSSLGRNRDTKMGATAADEMCNFYIMYYMKAEMEDRRGEENCADYNTPFNFPAGSDVKLPPNPALEEQAHHHHHHAMAGAEEKPTTAGVITSGVVHEPETNILVDEAKGNDAMEIGNHYKSQGNKHATSSNRNTNNLHKNGNNYNSAWQKPYLLDYDEYPDYYDIMRQRNRVKKPYYDLYDSRTNGFGDFADKLYNVDSRPLSKSRNRNKIFQNINKQHTDYYNDHVDNFVKDDSPSKVESKQYSDGSNSLKGVNSKIAKSSDPKLSSHTGKKGGHVEHDKEVTTKSEGT